MCIYIYICTQIHTYVYIYIYIYIQREREREITSELYACDKRAHGRAHVSKTSNTNSRISYQQSQQIGIMINNVIWAYVYIYRERERDICIHMCIYIYI